MMRDTFRWLLKPDDHAADPRAYLLHQAGHFGAVGMVGMLIAQPLGWWGLALVSCLYAAWEALQSRFGRQTLADAAEDWAFTTLGALAMALALDGSRGLALAAVAAAAVLLGLGIRSRDRRPPEGGPAGGGDGGGSSGGSPAQSRKAHFPMKHWF